MAEGSKVRVVRCPKCDNLQPEASDLSLYQCGGCGAVLRAKMKAPASDGFSKQSNEERGKGDCEKLESLSEEEASSYSTASETGRESDGIAHGRRNGRVFGERNMNLISSSSISNDGENMNLRLDRGGPESEIGHVDKYRRSWKSPVDRWVRGDVDSMNMNIPEAVNSSTEKDVGRILVKFTDSLGSSRSRAIRDQLGVERDQFGEFYRNSNSIHVQGSSTTSENPDEGPSNYTPSSLYGHDEPMKNHDFLDPDGRYRVEYLEQDRAELLRKLDELTDQLNRSYYAEEKPRERVTVDRKLCPPDPYGSRAHPTYKVSMQSSPPDKPIPRTPYFSHSHGPDPFMNYPDIHMQKLCFPPRHAPNEIPRYEDQFRPQMIRRPPHQPPPQYPQRPHDYFSPHDLNFNKDPLAYHPQETLFHQPSCSCLYCCNKNWKIPPQDLPAGFGNRRFPKDPINSNFYNNINPVAFGPQGYNPRGANPPLQSRDPQPYTRWSSNLDSDIDGFRPRRAVVPHWNKQFFHPVACGAPFITCYNCFELLKLPRRLKMVGNSEQKLQCGACSTVILLKSDNKRLIISVPTESKRISAKENDGSCGTLNDSLLSSHGCLNNGSMNSCCDVLDNSSYDLQLQDTEHNFLSEDHRLNLSESEKRQGVSSSSSIYSVEEESPDSVIVQGDVSNPTELPSKDDLSPRLPGSPFREHSDDVPSNPEVSRYGKGNKSKRTDQEIILDKKISRQNSVKDASQATEVEVYFNEFLNTSSSQDSVDVSKEDQSRFNKRSESFLVGLMKKGFRDFSRSNQTVEIEESNVSVNGQTIPDRVVKKAEKLAGPILPGDYWYDFRSGFWGVMGQPGQGIIPPFIDEFNYPMPTNCAAGNTGVYVNGRELHQKDLDLLAKRGLPTTRDKFYIIEICGRVVDEDSGEELESLGKLAPTVEKAKHGFGMKVRKVVA